MADFSKYYRAFMLMQETLKGDFTHNYIATNLGDNDEGKDVLSGKTYSRVIDMDWVEAIEDAIPYIDKAIREQRRFIIQNEDIVPIEKARKITNESVRHLAQHTNLIARVEGDNVTPERILDIQREESFGIYENRFLRTLLDNVSRFVDARYKDMKHAPTDSYHKVHMKRQIKLIEQELEFELTYSNESHESKEFDINADVSTLSDFQRVRRIRQVLGDFSASPIMRDLAKEERVRPPIQRTNLMTKNPNFKKALDLWLFIESYKKTGFEIVGKDFTGAMDEGVQTALYNVMSYEHFVISLATNPALQRMLHEKYIEENSRLELERLHPEEQRIAEVEARIAKVREEEMQIRLEEIRTREKQINDLNSQLNHAKFTLRQYETKITEMKGLINLHESTIQKLKDQVFELEKEVSVKAAKIEELTALCEEQKSLIAERDAKITALTADIEAKTAEIAKLNATIEEAKAVVAELKAKCDAYEAENTELKATVAAQVAAIAELKSECESLRNELYEKAEQIKILQADVDEKESAIAAKDAEISELKNNVDALYSELNTTKSQHAEELTKLKSDFASEKESIHSAHTAEIDALNATHAAAVAAQVATHTAEIKTLNDANDAKLNALKVETVQKIADTDARYAAEKAKLVQKYTDDISAKEEKHAKALADSKKLHEKAIDKLKADNAKQLDSQAKKYKAELNKAVKAAKAEANTRIKSAQKAADKRVTDAKGTFLVAGMSVEAYRKLVRFAAKINTNVTSEAGAEPQIFVDSSAVLPQELISNSLVSQLPVFRGEDAPMEILKLFKPVIESGREVVVITSGAGVSECREAVKTVCEELSTSKIALCDTALSNNAVGLLALKAAIFAAGGDNAKQIVKKLNSVSEKLEKIELRRNGKYIEEVDFAVNGCKAIKKFKSDSVSVLNQKLAENKESIDTQVVYVVANSSVIAGIETELKETYGFSAVVVTPSSSSAEQTGIYYLEK